MDHISVSVYLLWKFNCPIHFVNVLVLNLVRIKPTFFLCVFRLKYDFTCHFTLPPQKEMHQFPRKPRRKPKRKQRKRLKRLKDKQNRYNIHHNWYLVDSIREICFEPLFVCLSFCCWFFFFFFFKFMCWHISLSWQWYVIPRKGIKGKVHPEIKLVLIGVEKWEKQVSESLSKFRLKIRKLGFFKLWSIKHKLATLWRIMRAQLPFA